MSTLLTTATVAAYVKERLRGIADLPLDLDAELSALEITDGNLNYAWHVHEVGSPSRAVFVKQAPGFIKCLGPEFELSAQRAVFESAVLQEFHRLAPSHSPRHLLLDEARCVLVLQYLHGYVLLRTALQAGGGCGARVAGDLGRFMGETHRQTHAALLPEAQRAALEARFRNADMCGITAEYVFSKPLDEADETNRCSASLAPHAAAVRRQAGVREEVLALREVFETSRQCLVHGDLHTGSVMVAPLLPDAPAVVIDAEFAFYGPAAFDVGVMVANLFFAALRHAPHPDDLGAPQAWLLGMVAECWHAYVAVLARPAAEGGAPGALGEAGAVRELLREAAGFCGCELLRRVMGAAHVDDLETIADPHKKLAAERSALALGAALLTGRAALEDVGMLLELFVLHTPPRAGGAS